MKAERADTQMGRWVLSGPKVTGDCLEHLFSGPRMVRQDMLRTPPKVGAGPLRRKTSSSPGRLTGGKTLEAGFLILALLTF